LSCSDITKGKRKAGFKKGRTYTAEYRAGAVALAKEMGGIAAARQLKIPADTLYTWMSRAKSGDLPMVPAGPDPKASLNLAERVKVLENQVKALKGENAQILRENRI
jgi:transposase